MKEQIKKFLKKIGIYDSLRKIKLLNKALIRLYQLSIRKTIKNVQENGCECLKKAKTVCDNAGVFFWLDYGTLLGAVREKDFIAHDSDIDVGMLYDRRNEKLECELRKVGFIKTRDFIVDNKIVLETFKYKEVELDFFYYFTDDEKMWAYTFKSNEEMFKREEEGRIYVTGFGAFTVTFSKRGFTQLEFKNSMYKVPDPPEKYLAEVYGENFMKKDKYWNFLKSKNLERTDPEEILCIYYNN